MFSSSMFRHVVVRHMVWIISSESRDHIDVTRTRIDLDEAIRSKLLLPFCDHDSWLTRLRLQHQDKINALDVDPQELYELCVHRFEFLFRSIIQDDFGFPV